MASDCKAGETGEPGGEGGGGSLAADAAGNLYVAERYRIEKFDSRGILLAWGRDVVAGGAPD